MKLMQKVLAVMVLMLCGGGLSAASESAASLAWPTQQQRVEAVLGVLLDIDRADNVSAKNALYDEIRSSSGGRTKCYSSDAVVAALRELFPAYYEPYKTLTEDQIGAIKDCVISDWIYWFFNPNAMMAYAELCKEHNQECLVFKQLQERYCFDTNANAYSKRLLVTLKQKVTITAEQLADIKQWKDRADEGVDFSQYFRENPEVACKISKFVALKFNRGQILSVEHNRDLKYIYSNCTGSDLQYLRAPSTPASLDLRREACAMKWAKKSFNNCSAQVQALITSNLDDLMRPELAESYVQALANGERAPRVSGRHFLYNNEAIDKLLSLVCQEKDAAREIEKKASDEEFARNTAEAERKRKEFADQQNERMAALADLNLKAQQRRKVEAEQRALVPSEIELREAKEKDVISAKRMAEQNADSERVLRNQAWEKMIFAGGVGVLGAAIAALAIIPKKYKVSLREIFSPLPESDDFESFQDYRDTVAAIKSARSWLAGLGVLGIISALVASVGYHNLERYSSYRFSKSSE